MSERTTLGSVSRMSARDDYPEAAGPTLDAYVRQHVTMCDELNDLRERVVQERDLGQLMFFAQQRWQSMAEDLWEELQEWHAPKCLSLDLDAGACHCHDILAVKWDELTHADDRAEFSDEYNAE